MRGIWWIVVAVFLVPGTHATRPTVGTELEPELTDAENDVQYGPAYLGPRDRSFIDISIAWFDYAPSTDEVQFHLRVPDARSLENSPEDPDWRCATGSNLTGADARTGRLFYQWVKNFGSQQVRSLVTFSRNAGSESADIDHRFTFVPEAPGYFEWSIDRNTFLNLGDTITDLAVRCTELEFVAGFPTGTRNLDEATSAQHYTVGALERPRGPSEGDTDPPVPESSATSVQTDDATPAFAGLAALLAMTLALALARRRG